MDGFLPHPLPVLEAKSRADEVRRVLESPADRIVTCEDCVENAECEYAFDFYNTDGDCLAIK